VQLLEQRTVTATFQGQNQGGDQTATGEHLQLQQSMRPATTITDLIARTFIQPLSRIALKMLAQMTEEPQEFSIQNAKGEDIAAQVTPEDFAEGEFDVLVTMTHQDSTRLVQAQTIRDAIPMLEELIPRLNLEGSDLSFTELVKRFVELVKMPGSDRFITQISSKEQAMQKQIQDMQQQLEDKEQKPPTISISFKDVAMVAPDAAMQLLELAGIKASPQDLMNFGMPGMEPSQEGGPGMMPGNKDMGIGMGGMGENGGPMGPEPTDPNAMAQVYQEMMRPGAQTQ
jgi:hypothetical protein